MNDPFNLRRFLWAQEGIIEDAMEELRRGCKRSHWMWFVFPQAEGLGRSANAQKYAICSADEARAYLADPVLGSRLERCCELLLAWREQPIVDILCSVDALKLRSSMTLFLDVSGKAVFQQMLDAFFDGSPDPRTREILGAWNL